MGTTKTTEDMVDESFGMMVKETYGKENVELYQMAVEKICLKVESCYQVQIEVFYGNWM